jgi:hypothetical protein
MNQKRLSGLDTGPGQLKLPVHSTDLLRTYLNLRTHKPIVNMEKFSVEKLNSTLLQNRMLWVLRHTLSNGDKIRETLGNCQNQTVFVTLFNQVCTLSRA